MDPPPNGTAENHGVTSAINIQGATDRLGDSKIEAQYLACLHKRSL